MLSRAFINAIATAQPEYDFHDFFLRLMPSFLSTKDANVFHRLMARSQIEHRYSCLNLANPAGGFYKSGAGAFPTTQVRMAVYKEHAPRLAHQAATQLINDDLRHQITHILVGSCTGFYAPGLDCDLIASLTLRPDIRRRTIGFMGCYAGISVLQSASEIVRADPASVVLTVNLELCSLHFQKPAALHDMLGFALFADGCAAALVSAEPTGIEITGFESRLVPEHASAITWDITDQGFAMYLDPRLPKFLDGQLFDGVAHGDEQSWAIHPGGRSILDAVQDRLGLPDAQMEISRRVLRNFGNMSSATILFVLKELMQRPTPGPGCALAFGPGLAVEIMRWKM